MKEFPTANEENSIAGTNIDSNENDENNSEEDTQNKATGSDAIEQSHEILAKSYPVDDLLLVSKILFDYEFDD